MTSRKKFGQQSTYVFFLPSYIINKTSSICIFSFQFKPEQINNKSGESYRKFSTLKSAMHCVVFVIKATSDITHDDALRKIKAIQQRIDNPCNISLRLSTILKMFKTQIKLEITKSNPA